MRKRLLAFIYNIDRALAGLVWGQPQETISSEVGRHDSSNPIDDAIADSLDSIQKDHVETAITHANALDAADNGNEQ